MTAAIISLILLAFVAISQRVRITALDDELWYTHKQLNELEEISIAALVQRDELRATVAKQADELATLYEYNHDLENRLLYQQGDSMAHEMTYIQWLEWAGSIGLGNEAQS